MERIEPFSERDWKHILSFYTLQTHNVNATSDQRRYNVMTFMQRRVNVGATWWR